MPIFPHPVWGWSLRRNQKYGIVQGTLRSRWSRRYQVQYQSEETGEDHRGNVLVHIQEFNELKETLGIDDGSPTFKLFESLLHSMVRRDWRSKKQENAPGDEADDENDDPFKQPLSTLSSCTSMKTRPYILKSGYGTWRSRAHGECTRCCHVSKQLMT